MSIGEQYLGWRFLGPGANPPAKEKEEVKVRARHVILTELHPQNEIELEEIREWLVKNGDGRVKTWWNRTWRKSNNKPEELFSFIEVMLADIIEEKMKEEESQ
jgi:hypothetical protein